jgi:hypothetical protein
MLEVFGMYFIFAGGQVERAVSAHADVNGMNVFTLWFSSPLCFKIAAHGRPSLPELRFFFLSLLVVKP